MHLFMIDPVDLERDTPAGNAVECTILDDHGGLFAFARQPRSNRPFEMMVIFGDAGAWDEWREGRSDHEAIAELIKEMKK